MFPVTWANPAPSWRQPMRRRRLIRGATIALLFVALACVGG
jgi:hypothetical protein